MAILKHHTHLYREILELPGLLAEPLLQIGYQTIQQRPNLPEDFDYLDFKQALEARGLRDITSLDHFDPRAELQYDLNLPVPEHEYERYRTVIDIGTIEHVFDTRQCLENCLRMVTVGGHYFLVTAVKGHCGHGLHTFEPQVMSQALVLNNFEIIYHQFTSVMGDRIDDATDAEDSLIWVVGRKTAPIGRFEIPQQGRWLGYYDGKQRAGAT
jgi:hypothetical protein